MAKVTEKAGVQPDYGIGAMARRLGVAPATLRDWERRYGIGPGDRTAGGHRRYRPDDIARIENMRRLVLDGVPPGEAARVALAAALTPEPTAEPAAESAPEPTAGLAAESAVPLAGAAAEPSAGVAAGSPAAPPNGASARVRAPDAPAADGPAW